MNNIKEELLNKSLSWLENTEVFLSTELPVFIKEILVFNTFKYKVLIVAFLVLFIVSLISFFFFKHKIKEAKKSYRYIDDTDIYIFGIILSLIGSISFLGGAVSYSVSLYKIEIAPRLYLIETLSELINK